MKKDNYKWIALSCTTIGALFSVLSGSTLMIALPVIMKNLNASNLLNGIARGAVTFLLIFFFQGIKGIDPVMAGVLLAPLALSMMIVSPFSGYLSDKYGARALSSLGLLISAAGLIGMMFITVNTSTIELMIWMFIMGFGSGMFFSPNTSAIMGMVPPDKRGVAAGVRTMANNAGTVLSIAVSMAIISSSISPDAMEE